MEQCSSSYSRVRSRYYQYKYPKNSTRAFRSRPLRQPCPLCRTDVDHIPTDRDDTRTPFCVQDGRRFHQMEGAGRSAGRESAPRHPGETEGPKIGPKLDGLGFGSRPERTGAPQAGTEGPAAKVSFVLCSYFSLVETLRFAPPPPNCFSSSLEDLVWGTWPSYLRLS